MRSQLEQKALDFFAGGPGTARELAEHLGIAHETAKSLIGGLKAEGLLGMQRIRHRGVGGGSGQGQHIYGLIAHQETA